MERLARPGLGRIKQTEASIRYSGPQWRQKPTNSVSGAESLSNKVKHACVLSLSDRLGERDR